MNGPRLEGEGVTGMGTSAAPSRAEELSLSRRWVAFVYLIVAEFFYDWTWNTVDVLIATACIGKRAAGEVSEVLDNAHALDIEPRPFADAVARVGCTFRAIVLRAQIGTPPRAIVSGLRRERFAMRVGTGQAAVIAAVEASAGDEEASWAFGILHRWWNWVRILAIAARGGQHQSDCCISRQQAPHTKPGDVNVLNKRQVSATDSAHLNGTFVSAGGRSRKRRLSRT